MSCPQCLLGKDIVTQEDDTHVGQGFPPNKKIHHIKSTSQKTLGTKRQMCNRAKANERVDPNR